MVLATSPTAPATSPDSRVRQLIEEYAAERDPAYLLCDRHDPSATALRFVRSDVSVENLTYGELAARSRRLSEDLLAAGVGPGDRVATLMGKSVDLVVALLAVWRAGAVHVPLFTAFGSDAVLYRLRDSSAVAVICDAAQRPKVDQAVRDGAQPLVVFDGPPRSGKAFGLVASSSQARELATAPAATEDRSGDLFEIFTSGTTGTPKGVVVPRRALASFVAYLEFGLDVRADDVYWCAADPGWAYGLWYAITAPLAMGHPFVLVEGGFDTSLTWRVLAQLGVTNFAAAPTIYRALRVSERPEGSKPVLRCAASAGEPLTPEVNAWAAEALGLRVRDHYGQTEMGMLVNNHAHPALSRPIRDGSMGHPMPGWSVEILEPEADLPAPPGCIGRVAVRVADSPLMWFEGYTRAPEATAGKYAGDGRWYLTGDNAALDEDGYVHFSARADDVIIMAGYRIGPLDLESILVSHPAVVECAVVAAPDAMRGEIVEAFVVLRDPHDGDDTLAEELKQLVREKYGAHAYPRRVHFELGLPKTPSGKIQRNVLRARRRAETELSAAGPGPAPGPGPGRGPDSSSSARS